MDRGDLVPDDLIFDVIMERIDTPVAATASSSTAFRARRAQADALEGSWRSATAASRRRC